MTLQKNVRGYRSSDNGGSDPRVMGFTYMGHIGMGSQPTDTKTSKTPRERLAEALDDMTEALKFAREVGLTNIPTTPAGRDYLKAYDTLCAHAEDRQRKAVLKGAKDVPLELPSATKIIKAVRARTRSILRKVVQAEPTFFTDPRDQIERKPKPKGAYGDGSRWFLLPYFPRTALKHLSIALAKVKKMGPSKEDGLPLNGIPVLELRTIEGMCAAVHVQVIEGPLEGRYFGFEGPSYYIPHRTRQLLTEVFKLRDFNKPMRLRQVPAQDGPGVSSYTVPGTN